MRSLSPAMLPPSLWLAALALACGCAVDKNPSAASVPRPVASLSTDAGAVLAADPDGPAIFDVAVTATGFTPARMEVRPRQPVVLRITRTVADTCADAIDVQGDPVRHPLPLGRMVEVKFNAPASGEISFACPMNMVRGKAVVIR